MSASRQTKERVAAARYMLDAHHRALISCLVALAAAVLLGGHVRTPLLLVLTWEAFALSGLVMAWFIISTKDPYEARRTARLQDASATILFVLVICAATASLLAVGLVLRDVKTLGSSAMLVHVLASAGAVLISWTFVHTIFALRYAHFYFANAHEVERHATAGGLIFPGKDVPSYPDFAYFSFVIGMTCQVSDVQISAPEMRRLALVHGLISFVFNTAILAMFVNIVAGLV
ncbi:MAG TPA: DUF1345 domain-containing protein [Candidatus Methylacidiphilales bacterium]|jgi:uncharacterized membrane protein|nr:DUF1345 domain-containing protein [Candidatus Methylacidiphilales bacterium]